MLDILNRTLKIKEKAISLGFDACGVSGVGQLYEDRERLLLWLSKQHHAEMNYMERHLEKRLNPSALVSGTLSVISLLVNYKPEKSLADDSWKIGRYSYGKDYHKVIKKMMEELRKYIETEIENVPMRLFVDSAPVLEKSWAVKSGLGSVGKNSLLINRKMGSYLYIAEILIGMELVADESVENDLCGDCRLCLEACPNQAILDNKTIDARKCIAYHNKQKSGISNDFTGTLNGWIFGCDICQEACPWNSSTLPAKLSSLHPHPSLVKLDKEAWMKMSEDDFNKIFHGTLVANIGLQRLKENMMYDDRRI